MFIAISVIMMYNPIWPALKAFAPLERHKSMKKTLKTILIVLAAALFVCLGAIAIFYLRVNDPGNVFADAPVTREPVTVAPEATVTQAPPAAPPEASAAPVEPTPEPTATPISEAELEGMADLSFMKNRSYIIQFTQIFQRKTNKKNGIQISSFFCNPSQAFLTGGQ